MKENNQLVDSLTRLKLYCEAEDFKGWDPYDGLNSQLASAMLPLRHSAILRLCVIQGFKRCPVNLRRIAMVPKAHNAKGIGLFLQGYCNLYKAMEKHPNGMEALGTKKEVFEKIKYLADLLLKMRSDKKFPGEYHGACWGYNFDWQARRLFLFPAHTPTVVATSFCATALMEAYEITQNSTYLDVALSAAQFVTEDLHRAEYGDGFLFSYSKLKGNDTVLNASLLGSRLLSFCYKYTGNETYKELARKSIEACCACQQADGAWRYGMLPVQSWRDSFHTGYNLDSIMAYQEHTGDHSFEKYMKKGFDYYIKHFFEDNGTPKYYDNRMYPIDIHCPGQLFVTLARLHRLDAYRELADKVLRWTVCNMQDKKGYFYYQLKPSLSSKISYMRWSNAFMFCALSYYLLES